MAILRQLDKKKAASYRRHLSWSFGGYFVRACLVYCFYFLSLFAYLLLPPLFLRKRNGESSYKFQLCHIHEDYEGSRLSPMFPSVRRSCAVQRWSHLLPRLSVSRPEKETRMPHMQDKIDNYHHLRQSLCQECHPGIRSVLFLQAYSARVC